MKTCIKCNTKKELVEFRKDKEKFRSSCKECTKIERKIYVKENKEKIYLKTKQYNLDNSEIKKEKRRKYNEANKEEISLYKKIYNEINKEEVREQRKIYRKENKESLYQYNKQYHVDRKNTDPLFKITGSIRACVRSAFKRGENQFKKNAKTEEILCCTIKEFIIYIQNKFTEGMTLENHGEWHLDHIIPVSIARTEEEIISLSHYTNFQPLWAIDNLRKGNKIINKK